MALEDNDQSGSDMIVDYWGESNMKWWGLVELVELGGFHNICMWNIGTNLCEQIS